MEKRIEGTEKQLEVKAKHETSYRLQVQSFWLTYASTAACHCFVCM